MRKINVSGTYIKANDAPLTIELPRNFFAKARKSDVKSGKNVVIGLRAEHLSIDPDTFTAKTRLKVSHIEELGTESQVYGDLNYENEIELQSKTKVIIKAPTMTSFPIGNTIEVSIDIDNMHVFDAETEENLIPRIPDYSTFDVDVKRHSLVFDSCEVELPSAFEIDDGTYCATIPVDAVFKGKAICGTVQKIEEINGKYLHHVSVDNRIIFALLEDENNGTIELDIDLKRIRLTSERGLAHDAIPMLNVLEGKLLRQRNKDKRSFKEIISSAALPKFSFEVLDKSFECTRELASKLVGIGGIKILGKKLRFEFSPYDVQLSEDGILFEVESILDYGMEKFAKCVHGDVRLCVSVGDDFSSDSIRIGLPVEKSSVIDVEGQIRLK